MDGDKQKDDGDSLLNNSNVSQPIWVRYFGVQTDTINQRLLAHNVRVICVCGPILWAVLSILQGW